MMTRPNLMKAVAARATKWRDAAFAASQTGLRLGIVLASMNLLLTEMEGNPAQAQTVVKTTDGNVLKLQTPNQIGLHSSVAGEKPVGLFDLSLAYGKSVVVAMTASGAPPSGSNYMINMVGSGAGKGWVKVVMADSNKTEVSLPAYLKLRIESCDTDDRYTFTILEGQYKGKRARTFPRDGNVDILVPASGHTTEGLLTLTFNNKTRKDGVLKYGSNSIKVTVDQNPLPSGTYRIKLPDHPHKKGDYPDEFSKTWFPIEDSKVADRYVHAGAESAGCVTIVERPKWNSVYTYLIKRRNGTDYVGKLEVK